MTLDLNPLLTALQAVAARLAWLVAATCAIAVVAYLVLRPDLWLVERVRFVGASKASVAQLRHLADLPNGTLIWQVKADQVTESVERHPWVRRASVTVVWPNEVQVSVKEHRVAALITRQGRLYTVAQTGEVFHPASLAEHDHPFITGLTPELESLHPDLGPLVIRDALRLIRELDERNLVLRTRISEVAFSPTLGFTVHTNGAQLVFGHGSIRQQLDRLRELQVGGVDLSEGLRIDLGARDVATIRPLHPAFL